MTNSTGTGQTVSSEGYVAGTFAPLSSSGGIFTAAPNAVTYRTYSINGSVNIPTAGYELNAKLNEGGLGQGGALLDDTQFTFEPED